MPVCCASSQRRHHTSSLRLNSYTSVLAFYHCTMHCYQRGTFQPTHSSPYGFSIRIQACEHCWDPLLRASPPGETPWCERVATGLPSHLRLKSLLPNSCSCWQKSSPRSCRTDIPFPLAVVCQGLLSASRSCPRLPGTWPSFHTLPLPGQ